MQCNQCFIFTTKRISKLKIVSSYSPLIVAVEFFRAPTFQLRDDCSLRLRVETVLPS